MKHKPIAFIIASALALSASAQIQRTSVLEEFSTANCQFCPEGYATIKKAIDNHPGTIWLVHHAGFMTDDITIAESERLTFLYGTNAFAPAYMIDRTVPAETYTDYSPVWPVDDSARIASQLDEMAAKPCYATININNLNYDVASRTVTATISGYITQEVDTAMTRLTVYLVEDSIVLRQASTTGTIEDYIHMHAVRGCATGYLGDHLTFSDDGTFSYNLDYTIPQKALASHCRLVALIHYAKATNLTLNNILNATSTTNYLTPHTAGIDDIAPNQDFCLYPNPTKEYATLQTNVPTKRITVTDMMGRTVYALSPTPSETSGTIIIPTRNWHSGIYLVTIETEHGCLTKKLKVNND